jgi:hypothetical protein
LTNLHRYSSAYGICIEKQKGSVHSRILHGRESVHVYKISFAKHRYSSCMILIIVLHAETGHFWSNSNSHRIKDLADP